MIKSRYFHFKKKSIVALSFSTILFTACNQQEKNESSGNDSLQNTSNIFMQNTTWTKANKENVPAAPASGETYYVRYKSIGAKGDSIFMTGLVTLPADYNEGINSGKRYPVFSWAHGTTGIANRAAPSLFKKGGPNEEALTMVANYLDRWLQQGYIIIQPDYEGLGVAEAKGTYLNRQSLSHAINGLVKATMDEYATTGEWINAGWSQGGYASIVAADKPYEGLKLTICIAPGDSQLVPPDFQAKDLKPEDVLSAIEGDNLGFIPILLGGAINASSDVKADDFLSEKGKQMITKADELGLTELRTEFKNSKGKEMIKENPNTKALQEYMDSQRLELSNPQGPVLILLGTNDVTVTGSTVRNLAKGWQQRGLDVTFEEVKNADHRASVHESFDTQLNFANKFIKK